MTGARRIPEKVPAANRGAASIIYFNYGNAPSETLVQEALKLKKGMEGYNKTVLLKYEEAPNWLNLSEKDEGLPMLKTRLENPTSSAR